MFITITHPEDEKGVLVDTCATSEDIQEMGRLSGIKVNKDDEQELINAVAQILFQFDVSEACFRLS